LRTYNQTHDSRSNIGSLGERNTHVVHDISHVIPDYMPNGDALYITTYYEGSAHTFVTDKGRDGMAPKLASALIEGPADLQGDNADALRAYHLGIVEDYAAEPPRRTFKAQS